MPKSKSKVSKRRSKKAKRQVRFTKVNECLVLKVSWQQQMKDQITRLQNDLAYVSKQGNEYRALAQQQKEDFQLGREYMKAKIDLIQAMGWAMKACSSIAWSEKQVGWDGNKFSQLNAQLAAAQSSLNAKQILHGENYSTPRPSYPSYDEPKSYYPAGGITIKGPKVTR